MEFMKIVKENVKKLLGNKDVREIIKFIATNVIQYASNKFNIMRYKYDKNDLKTMVYNHNLNNNDNMKYKDIDSVVDLLTIRRFIESLSDKQNVSMKTLINDVSRMTGDNVIINEYEKIENDNKILSFDEDTLETTAIADTYEINSGGIYVPNREIYLNTFEGQELANAKNDYLEERAQLGDNPDGRKLREIMNKYYDRIHFDEMRKSGELAWKEVYSIKDVMKVKDLSPKSVVEWAEQMWDNEEMFQEYMSRYHTGDYVPGSCDHKCKVNNLCSLLYITKQDRDECKSSH